MNDSNDLFAQLFSTETLDSDQEKKCRLACELAIKADNLPHLKPVRGYTVAQILAGLKLDKDTIIAALVSDGNLEQAYPIATISEWFGVATANLVTGIRQLNQFKHFDMELSANELQNERLRQMLLTMTSDIRIMVMKLAYRVARLRALKEEPTAVRKQIASETEMIFSPLANRLGIAQLKWELEDLSFRFLHPEDYKKLANQLKDKRSEREAYINTVLQQLNEMLTKHNIHAKTSGRPKHIYSIWKKMQRKKLHFDELYDLRAVRIYVESLQACYEVLGLIHSRWNYIRDEFDDYIATPKENGYQSIHTVIIGPEGKTVEIQIRTFDMHHYAEYGVAAHWRYKEGHAKRFDENLEQSIANVRHILESSDDPSLLNEISTELESVNIYVMTPNNEIITLRQGSTPLDFAYQIHTELGHRCRGAKVNGRIQPLSYTLKTGDKVEVLTIKSGQPKRNWLNPNLGYLTSSSARQKVRNWLNKQNQAENTHAGEALLNRELKRLHAQKITSKELASYFKHSSSASFFEDIGKGRINERQLTQAIQKQLTPKTSSPSAPRNIDIQHDTHAPEEAFVVGASHLSTHLAPCCEPSNQDDIVGYVTRGRGVTVHKTDCKNILHLSDDEKRRLIEVSWNQKQHEPTFLAELEMLGFDRKGLLRDIMLTISTMDINVLHSQTQTHPEENTVSISMKMQISYAINLGDVLDKLESIANIESVAVNSIH